MLHLVYRSVLFRPQEIAAQANASSGGDKKDDDNTVIIIVVVLGLLVILLAFAAVSQRTGMRGVPPCNMRATCGFV